MSRRNGVKVYLFGQIAPHILFDLVVVSKKNSGWFGLAAWCTLYTVGTWSDGMVGKVVWIGFKTGTKDLKAYKAK